MLLSVGICKTNKKYFRFRNPLTDVCMMKKSLISFMFTGIDKLLAQHIAHLFIRDPLSVFEEKIHLDDENESDHFEVRFSEF